MIEVNQEALEFLKGQLAGLRTSADKSYQHQKELEKLGLDLDYPSVVFEKGREGVFNDAIVIIKTAVSLLEVEVK